MGVHAETALADNVIDYTTATSKERKHLPGNLPGEAAPSLDIPYLSRSNSSFSSRLVHPLRLVDYGSLKKSIWLINQ